MIKTVEGLGIEYDENVVCDVCRSVSFLSAVRCIHFFIENLCSRRVKMGMRWCFAILVIFVFIRLVTEFRKSLKEVGSAEYVL
jgi:hypothetical protein